MTNRPRHIHIVGPLSPFAEGYLRTLVARGYAKRTVASHKSLVIDANRWLSERGLGARDLTPEVIEEYAQTRRAAGCWINVSKRGMQPLVAYLVSLGVLDTPTLALDPLLVRYRHYLVSERGLMEATVVNYVGSATSFLAWHRATSLQPIETLKAQDLIDFMVAEARRRKGSARSVVAPLRSFLRFLFVDGVTPVALAGAVPRVANWRLAGLPRGITPDEVERLLLSCDRSTSTGLRDFAILKVFTRLGLRVGEVERLELEDLDWRAGELVVRGKGNRIDKMPLPVDVGVAIADWLRSGRPKNWSRALFSLRQAPYGPISRKTLSSVVATACRGGGVRVVSPHQLRHTAAINMLGAGAGLVEIGQVLRHQSALTTAIYAKADRRSLALLAQPWPGVA